MLDLFSRQHCTQQQVYLILTSRLAISRVMQPHASSAILVSLSSTEYIDVWEYIGCFKSSIVSNEAHVQAC